jgi:abequosyltransferase
MVEAEEFVLSICIATRNRADVIGETLKSILSQMSGAVEIVVLDGASTDNTRQVVESHQPGCAGLRYHRLAINGGIDRDFDRAVEEARGRYCWLMSDDDLLRPGAVAAVLAAIKQDFSLIIVNSEVRSRDMTSVIEPKRMTLDRDVVFQPTQMNELFEVVAAYASFIGCVVVLRSLWLSRRRQEYFGSMFVHIGVIFQAPLPGRALAMATPLISIRYANAGWKSSEFEIWMFKWPALLWSLDAIDVEVRRKVQPAEPWRKPSTLLFYRAKGSYSLAVYRRLLKPLAMGTLQRLVVVAVAWVPGVIANMIALLYSFKPGSSALMIRTDVMGSKYFPGNWFHARN